MTTKTQAIASTQSTFLPILGIALIGIAILFTTGFAQAEMLHNSAHDVRHSIGFACH